MSTSFTQSPIGTIPRDFTELVKLCHKAYIRYNDIKLKDGSLFREWKILCDDNLATDKKGNTTGRKCTEHKKFVMIMDEILYNNPEIERNELLSMAIVAPKIACTWQDQHNNLAKKGVHGYETLMAKSKKNSIDDIDF